MSTPTDAVARYAFLADPEGRRRRARRIARALSDFGDVDVASARILDVGCSAGLIAAELALHAREVIGVDPDVVSVALAQSLRVAARPLSFVAAAGEALPFRAASFDAVVCNHVYEHARDPLALMAEIRRVLRPGGACYCATGHTLQLIEPHHRLPLLSALPRGMADVFLRAAGKGASYEERFLPPWKLRSLFAGFATVELVSPAMLRDPARFEFPSLSSLPTPLRAAIRRTASPLAHLAPTWIWVARR